ncbi:hypothetical protein M2371_001963 [Buttiauxella sp. BIGb0471]|uniref:hypothetical protein n=1 Tax=Buttiauxella sp. BIGb0471 TaxID=2940597 RepID=UPI002169A637|nr:hypothetical protein [Buttiauxella sp. BIGb0471]MCS3602754.1 hypothetical protein [Buttiauxella sp. BIGb0471]
MAWGFQTWDAKGKPNNYGLVPVTVVGQFAVALDQVTGSATYSVPAGHVLDYIHSPRAFFPTTKRRIITIRGGTVTLSQGGDTSYGIGSESAQAAMIVVYVRKA